MGFVVVANTDEIPAGQMKAVDAAGQQILIVNIGGTCYALGRKCTHMGGDLSMGKLEGTTVTCPRHGARFDVTTGSCISGPKVGPLKLTTKNEATFEVRVVGKDIQVNV